MLLADWKWASAIKLRSRTYSQVVLQHQPLCYHSCIVSSLSSKHAVRDTDKHIHPDNDTLKIEKSGLSEFANKHKANLSLP